MSPGALGAFLLVLVLVFLVGRLWFHLVEFLLDQIKRLLSGKREPHAWHPLPEEPEEQEGENQK